MPKYTAAITITDENGEMVWKLPLKVQEERRYKPKRWQGPMLTEIEFGRVQMLRADDLSSAQIASKMKIDLRQVNFAFLAKNYAAYQKHYKYQTK